MPDLEMPGLTVGPMGAWLSAVGILRAVSRTDPDAALFWDGDVPVLRTRADGHPEREIADRMVFSPIVTPWQAGGGWGTKDKEPARRLEAIRGSANPRLAPLREAVQAADRIVAKARVAGWDKARTVLELRNWLPDEATAWLDVAVPLLDEGARDGQRQITVGWAPLAGTGGNDGRWDLSTNYHAAITAIAPGEQPAPDGSTGPGAVAVRRGQLADLLYGHQHQPLIELSGGPYWPSAGQPRLLNPWAMILTAEGLLAFAAGVREHGQTTQPWTTPMIEQPDQDGEEPGWGEAWLPMWSQPMTYREAHLVLSVPLPRWPDRRGGEWVRRPAVRPIHMLMAFRDGGWPTGVTGFARYALARRRGLNHDAVPLDKVFPKSLPPVMLMLADAAARAGVGDKTWSAYVNRGQAPQRDDRDPVTGRPRWWDGTVDAWKATRPGSGRRTDL